MNSVPVAHSIDPLSGQDNLTQRGPGGQTTGQGPRTVAFPG